MANLEQLFRTDAPNLAKKIDDTAEKVANLSSLGNYNGQWDAATNTPNLSNPTGLENGSYYDIKGTGTQVVKGRPSQVYSAPDLLKWNEKTSSFDVVEDGGVALAKISTLQDEFYSGQNIEVYKHPAGDAEYLGNADYPANGGGVIVPPFSTDQTFNVAQFRAGLMASGDVHIRIYQGDVTNAVPSASWNLLYETTQAWNTDNTITRRVQLPVPIQIQAGKSVLILFGTLTANQVKIRRWNVSAENRLRFVYSSGTATSIFDQPWIVSSGEFYGVPALLTLDLPYAKTEDVTALSARTTTAEAALAEIPAKYISSADYFAPVDKIIYKHPAGDAEYLGNADFTANATGIVLAARPSSYSFNQALIKAARNTTAGQVFLRVYYATAATGIPETAWTPLGSELTLNWDTNQNTFKTINFPTPLTVPAGRILILAFSTKTSEQVKIRRWNINNTDNNRGIFVYSSNANVDTIFAQNWLQSGDPFFGIPPILNLVVPYAKVVDLATVNGDVTSLKSRATALEGRATTLEGQILQNTTGLANLTSGAITTIYKHPNGDPEYVGSSNFSNRGAGVVVPQQSSAYTFNQAIFKAWRASAGQVFLRVYHAATLAAKPETSWTQLGSELTLTWDATVNSFKTVDFPAGLTVPSNRFLIFAFATKTTEQVSIRYWNTNGTPSRGFFVHCSSTNVATIFAQDWQQSDGSLGFYGIPAILNAVPVYATNSNLGTVDQRLAVAETKITALETNPGGVFDPRLTLPSKIFATVGLPLSLQYDAMILAADKGLASPVGVSVEVNATKGRMNERAWNFTPAAGDVGTYTAKIRVYDKSAAKLQEKITSLIVQGAVPFASPKNILVAGDSLTANGPLVATILANLTAQGGTTPTFWGLQGSGAAKHEGRPGWTYNYFRTAGPSFWRFNVTGFTGASIGATYTNNGATFTVREINVSAGSGLIRCEVSGNGTPASSGTLTKTAGSGDATITFTASALEPANPFWNIATGQLDIANYRQTLGMGTAQFDVVSFLLGPNECLGELKTDAQLTTVINDAKAIANAFLADNPATKIIFHLPTISGNTPGGFGANYNSSQSKEEYRLNIWALRLKLLAAFDNGAFNANVIVGSAGLSLDRFYGYGRTTIHRFNVSGATRVAIGATYTNNGTTFTVKENLLFQGSGTIRCEAPAGGPTATGTLTKASGPGDATLTFSSTTAEQSASESTHINAVHPSDPGYQQLADAITPIIQYLAT